MITYQGKTNSYAGWARETGIPAATIRNRIEAGWPLERALTEKVKEGRRAGDDGIVAGYRYGSLQAVKRSANPSAWYFECIHCGLTYLRRSYDIKKSGDDTKCRCLSVPEKKLYTGVFEGEEVGIIEIARRYNLRVELVRERLSRGMTLEQAVKTPTSSLYLFKGGYYTPKELAALPECAVDVKCLKLRIFHKWDIEKAVTTPYLRNRKTRTES
jgi:hypothetical protein